MRKSEEIIFEIHRVDTKLWAKQNWRQGDSFIGRDVQSVRKSCSEYHSVPTWVSYETQIISKEPKLEEKLVSTLSETKRLISVVSRNSEIAGFGVSVEPKLTTLDATRM